MPKASNSKSNFNEFGKLGKDNEEAFNFWVSIKGEPKSDFKKFTDQIRNWNKNCCILLRNFRGITHFRDLLIFWVIIGDMRN